MTVIGARTLVTGEAVLSPGFLRIEGGLVVEVSTVGETIEHDLVVPGFVDMHVHGGGGYAYDSPSVDDHRLVAAFHRRHGTTSTLASLVAADEESLTRSLGLLAGLVREGVLAGVHLEGPWLSPARKGAHEPRFLRDPSPGELERLLAAGEGTVRMITVAPELPGAIRLIERIAAAGVVAAIGHTEADYETTRRAIDAGATVGTHLFNAERGLHHREPGPIPALLADPRVTVEVIADGVHLHPAVLALVVAAAGADRVALVTDAMAATGRPDGTYSLGSLAVTVSAGVARLASDGGIAGSTVTTDQLFRTAAEMFGLLDAVRMVSVNPARALGLPGVGRLTPGHRADLVVLTSDLTVESVSPVGPVSKISSVGTAGAGSPA